MGRKQTLTISELYNFLIDNIFPIRYSEIIEQLKSRASEATINRRLKELREGNHIILKDGFYYVNDGLPPTLESQNFLEKYKKRVHDGEKEDSEEWNEYFELKNQILRKLKLEIIFNSQEKVTIPLTRLVLPDKDFELTSIPYYFNSIPNMFDGLVQLIYSFITDCILNNPFLWTKIKEPSDYDFTITLTSKMSNDKRIYEMIEKHRKKCIKLNWLRDIRFSRHSEDIVKPDLRYGFFSKIFG